MPNINSLTAINTATSSTYIVVSDNGFARRVSFESFTHGVEQGFAGPARTNQNLYTTSTAQFRKISLIGVTTASNSGTPGNPVGFSSRYSSHDGSNIKDTDIIGNLRFGGFDGSNLPDGMFRIVATANNDWNYSGGTTTDAGVNWAISYQPENVRVNNNSTMKIISGGSTSTNDRSVPPVMVLKIGSGLDQQTPSLTSNDGVYSYTGYGRTELGFYHSRITQYGVVSGGTADNQTLGNTNSYTFYTSRKNAADNARRLHVQQNDTIGQFSFNAAESDGTSGNGIAGARISANTTEEWTTSTNGTQLVFSTAPKSYTVSTGTSTTIISSTSTSRRLTLNDQQNAYNSSRHTFQDSRSTATMLNVTTGSVSMLDNQFTFINNVGLRFLDGTIQKSAACALQLPPANSNAPGEVGQIASDAGYVYICVNTNQWLRVPASTF